MSKLKWVYQCPVCKAKYTQYRKKCLLSNCSGLIEEINSKGDKPQKVGK